MSGLNAVNEKIGKYRWTICGLVFFATTVNYMDRQVLSLLKDQLEMEFNWTDTDYSNIVAVFQFVYAISMLFAGRFVDWLGTKLGYAWSLIIWSVGAMLHALAKGTGGFMIARGVLGFGEAGNFPAAIKAMAEWFPKKERALATGIFNSGTNVGAILAPVTVPWIALHLGWQAAFLIIGGIGFFWLIFWFWLYELPEKQKRLGKAEFDYIHSDDAAEEAALAEARSAKEVRTATAAAASGSVSESKAPEAAASWYKEWAKLLTYRQTWSFATGKFLTDGIWWFFLFWLPAYLKAQYGMTQMDVALPIAVLYTMTCFGSVGGGWFPAYFINKGYEPYTARMRAMFVIAIFPLVVLLAQPLGHLSYWVPVILIGIGASAHQAWSANIFTTVSDMFPKKAVGSVVGIGGMFGGLGGIVVNKAGGWLFDAYRQVGIAQGWAEAKAAQMGAYVDSILSMKLVNKYDSVIDLNKVELGSLPKEVVEVIQSADPAAFVKMKELQAGLVHAQMTEAYTIMFAVCALAYVTAWIIMKTLVPRFKRIEGI